MRKHVHDVNIKPARRSARAPAKGPARDSDSAAYHHGNLRQALLDAGLALLEAGAAGEPGELSLRELARRVGVSANASYRHFADKDALLMALAAEGFRRMGAAQARAALTERQPKLRHRAAGKAYIRFARDNPALFRLMFGRFSASHRSEELSEAGGAAFEALRAGVAQARGLPPGDPGVMVAAMHSWALVHGLSLLLLDGQIDRLGEDPDTLIEAILEQAAESAPAPNRGKGRSR